MKRLFLLIIFVLLLVSPIFSVKYFGTETTVDFDVKMGIEYHFSITTDYSSYVTNYIFSLPLGFAVDTRFIEWFSLILGVDFSYELNVFSRTIAAVPYVYYHHSLFIDIPFGVNFYPLVYKNDYFWNLYIGIGGIVHFWPVNRYYVENKTTGETFTGDAYNPVRSELDPGSIYTPVNFGMQLSLGNYFPVSPKILLGLKLYLDYLFIPITNGYYSNNYSRGNSVLLEFDLKIGIAFIIRARLRG